VSTDGFDAGNHRLREADRPRLAFLVPEGNVVFESDAHNRFGPNVEIAVRSVPWRPMPPADQFEARKHLSRSVAGIADWRADAVCLACTTMTTTNFEARSRYAVALETLCGCPATTVGDAMLAALNDIGARTIAVITPYSQRATDAVRDFFASEGFRVLDAKGLGLSAPDSIQAVEPRSIALQAALAAQAGVDRVVLACANFRALEALELLPTETRQLCLTSNQAALAATHALAVGSPGLGR
jgi:maleate isomerase